MEYDMKIMKDSIFCTWEIHRSS